MEDKEGKIKDIWLGCIIEYSTIMFSWNGRGWGYGDPQKIMLHWMFPNVMWKCKMQKIHSFVDFLPPPMKCLSFLYWIFLSVITTISYHFDSYAVGSCI